MVVASWHRTELQRTLVAAMIITTAVSLMYVMYMLDALPIPAALHQATLINIIPQ